MGSISETDKASRFDNNYELKHTVLMFTLFFFGSSSKQEINVLRLFMLTSNDKARGMLMKLQHRNKILQIKTFQLKPFDVI